MMRSLFGTAALLSTFTLLTGPGCLGRKETITVSADGRVRMAIEYAGETKDFETQDALPSQAGGWNISRTTKKDGDKETTTLTAERTFAAGEDLPGSFAAANDPHVKEVLHFPTTLKRETRPDGTYFVFRRVYAPRPWSYISYWEDAFVGDDIKKLGEKPQDQLTRDERKKILEAFVNVEAYRQMELCQSALKESHPEVPVEARLGARRALLNVFEGAIDGDAFVDRFEGLPEGERDQNVEKESQRLIGEAQEAFRKELKVQAKYDARQIEDFDKALARVKRQHDITGETGGHAFEIRVEMPGEIVAHNGDEETDQTTVQWEFDGRAFRDRPQELVVISRVLNGVKERTR